MKVKPLFGPFAKVERAKTHIEELNTKIRAFLDSKPHTLLGKFDYKKNHAVWSFVLPHDPPGELATIVADVLSNLRSALDQLACAIALEHSSSTTGTYFPFGRDAAHFESELASKCKKLPTAAHAMIRALKPYKGGNDLLLLLHDLNTREKHVRLTPICVSATGDLSTLVVTRGMVLTVGPRNGTHMVRNYLTGHLTQPVAALQPQLVMTPEGPRGRYAASSGPYKRFEFATSTANAEFHHDFKPTFEVSLADVEGFEREPVVAVLHQMAELVERTLVTFEQAFFP